MAPMLRLAGRLGLGRGEFVSLCERVGRDWAEWSKLLQIRTEDAPRVFAEVGRARRGWRGAERRPRRGRVRSRVQAVGRGRRARGPRAAARRARAAGIVLFTAAGADAALEAALDIQPQLLVADWSEWGTVVRGLRDMRSDAAVRDLHAGGSDDDGAPAGALGAGLTTSSSVRCDVRR